ncbi:MAG: hypothetical protein KGL43_09565 [Burkholderiales bacterium]|nr:hypothetical protein [Burkholderiales bacterium]MDE2453830.1 hypothetical protein [Burkholderiales bacterium]
MTTSSRLIRLATGVFAGALGAFFPRIVAVLGGNVTDEVVVFSMSYALAGAVFALVIGVVVSIIDTDPKRSTRDVFMGALGVPTLLAGALSTSATVHNTALDQARIKAISDQLAAVSQIQVQPESKAISLPAAGAAPAAGGLGLLEGLIPNAQAQNLNLAQQRANDALGISSVERRYVTVLHEAASPRDLQPMMVELQKRGVATRIVTPAPGRSLLLLAGPAQPYSEALLGAVRAKSLGVHPSLVPVK